MPTEYQIVGHVPHDVWAFTQGLAWHAPSATLLESTGRYGDSTLRRYRPGEATPQQRVALPGNCFGEGIALAPVGGNELIYQFTWRERRVFVYELRKDAIVAAGERPLEREVWGATGADDAIWISDGSARLRQLDAVTLARREELEVRLASKPLEGLNDFTYLPGARQFIVNIYPTGWLARIDAGSGEVVARYDLRGLLPFSQRVRAWARRRRPILNGLAWRQETNTLLVTGKHWSRIYELRLPE